VELKSRVLGIFRPFHAYRKVTEDSTDLLIVQAAITQQQTHKRQYRAAHRKLEGHHPEE